MRAVIQRVCYASVTADGVLTGQIGKGLFLLLGVFAGDTEKDALRLSEKIAKLRIFSDADGKMNLSVNDVGGGALVVSNFTLCASYEHGNRPDYLKAAKPGEANRLYETFLTSLRQRIPEVAAGVFGADMRIHCEADGPVTIVMDSELLRKGKNE